MTQMTKVFKMLNALLANGLRNFSGLTLWVNALMSIPTRTIEKT